MATSRVFLIAGKKQAEKLFDEIQYIRWMELLYGKTYKVTVRHSEKYGNLDGRKYNAKDFYEWFA